MIGMPSSVKIFICSASTDMRKSFDSLAAIVREFMGGDPLSGHLFVFRNKAGDRVKILYWERTGYCLYYKRLEEGTFGFPVATSGNRVEVAANDLWLMLEGIELAKAKWEKRYAWPAKA